MRMKALFVVAILTAIGLSCFQIHAQDAASAKTFLRDVYRHYQGGYRGDSSGIDLDGPYAGLYYHSSLLALEKADVKANRPDIPAIDYDPICGCQDWEGIWNLEIEVRMDSLRQVKASVSFSLSDPKDNSTDAPRKLEITLMSEHGKWHIYDILDKSDPKLTFSMRQLLEKDLADLRSHRAPAPH